MERRQFITGGIAVAAAACVNSRSGSAEMPGTQNPNRSEHVVKLIARPGPIDLDLSKTAVLVVDMQNDFCSKGGLLDLQGVDLAITQRAIAPTRIVLSAARNAGLKIIYLKMAIKPDLSDLALLGHPIGLRAVTQEKP